MKPNTQQIMLESSQELITDGIILACLQHDLLCVRHHFWLLVRELFFLSILGVIHEAGTVTIFANALLKEVRIAQTT